MTVPKRPCNETTGHRILYVLCLCGKNNLKWNIQYLIYICLTSVSFLADSDIGYVHSLSPIKKGRNGKDYYSFQLQTDETNLTRTVGFDKRTYAKINHFVKTGSPVKLVNIHKKDDQIFVNSSSSIFEASKEDVLFQKIDDLDSEVGISSDSIDIKLEQLRSLSTKQRVNIEGVVTLGSAEPKKVNMRSQSVAFVKEDCGVEDETGTAILHIWENCIKECDDGVAYKICNLTIKNFSGEVFLATTAETTFTHSEFHKDVLQGKEVILGAEKEIVVPEFKMVDKIVTFYMCQNKSCNRRMPSLEHGAAIFTCEVCGTSQKVKNAKKVLSGRMCIELDGEDMWLSAFTDVMQSLMLKAGLDKSASVDKIINALLTLQNIPIKINTKSKYLLQAF